MEIIKHRINSIEEFDSRYGCEIDVRDFNGEIVLSHDIADSNSIKLDEFLQNIAEDKIIAINIKASEIGKKVKSILDKAYRKNYFVFDFSIPDLMKSISYGLNCAFRLSEYEKEIIPNCNWVWIDMFEKIWYDQVFLKSIKEKGLKIALVSPELHNRNDELKEIKELVDEKLIDAICTDFPDRWK